VVTSSPLEEQEAHPNYSDHHTLCVCVCVCVCVLETSIGSKLVQFVSGGKLLTPGTSSCFIAIFF